MRWLDTDILARGIFSAVVRIYGKRKPGRLTDKAARRIITRDAQCRNIDIRSKGDGSPLACLANKAAGIGTSARSIDGGGAVEALRQAIQPRDRKRCACSKGVRE